MSNHAASRKHYYTVLLDRTLVCFLLVVVLNFFLPRLLPGNPVAYLTGFSEQDMTPAQVAFYEDALHLNNYVGIIVVYLGLQRSLASICGRCWTGRSGIRIKRTPPSRRSSAKRSAIRCKSLSRRCCFQRGSVYSGGFGVGTKRIRLPIAFPQQR